MLGLNQNIRGNVWSTRPQIYREAINVTIEMEGEIHVIAMDKKAKMDELE